MTLSEFKAWFEGFTESLSGPPNPDQWKRIQDRVKQIAPVTVTNHYLYKRTLVAAEALPYVYDPRLAVQNINHHGQTFNQTRELRARCSTPSSSSCSSSL